ncbi:6746_t:CDS:1, partial [Gigaspora margarita]
MALFYLLTCNQKECNLAISNDNHSLKYLLSHLFKGFFNTFSAPENTPEKSWIFPDLKTETFNLNQPNTATFTKPIPISQLKELATKIAKKFAKENSVSETADQHIHYFYSYLKIYLKTAAANDGIQGLNLENVLQYLITPNINPHIPARVIIYYDIQNQSRIFIKNIKEQYSTVCLPQAEEFIISYYKITIPKANNNTLFFSPKATNQDNHMDKTTYPLFNNLFYRN